MAKQGMKRPEDDRNTKKNSLPPVPELQGKAKRGTRKAGPMVPGTNLFVPGTAPISPAYPVIDTDLGRDNVENDLTAADLQDL